MGIATIDTARTVLSTAGGGNTPTTSELVLDVHSKLQTTYSSLAPLTTILDKMGSDPARSFKVEWIEEHAIPTKLKVGTQLGSGGTDLVVTANGATAVADSVLFNPRSWDYARVSSVSGNDITIVRDTNGSTGAVWLAGDILHVLPTSIPENDSVTYRSASLQNDNVFNYTQLIRMNYTLTRTMDNISVLPGNTASKRDSLMRQKFREVREKWELLTIMGGRAVTNGTAATARRDSGGLVHFLRNGTLFKDFAGIMTESGFRSFARDYKDENPETIDAWCFVSGNVADIMTDWGLDKVRLSPESKKYGLEINQYKAAGITFKIVAMPLLTDPQTRGWGFILDMERLRLKILSPLTWHGDALGVGQSELIHDLYRLQASLLVGAENKHAMFVGALL